MKLPVSYVLWTPQSLAPAVLSASFSMHVASALCSQPKWSQGRKLSTFPPSEPCRGRAGASVLPCRSARVHVGKVLSRVQLSCMVLRISRYQKSPSWSLVFWATLFLKYRVKFFLYMGRYQLSVCHECKQKKVNAEFTSLRLPHLRSPSHETFLIYTRILATEHFYWTVYN